MPPSACSNLPRRPRTPVAVRSSMPNSSASSSVSTSAAQLTATNGRRAGPELVNLACDELLARAALALDQHREVGVRDPLDPARAAPGSGGVDPISGARRRWTGNGAACELRGHVRSSTKPPTCAPRREHWKSPFAKARSTVKRRFEHALLSCPGLRARSSRRAPGLGAARRRLSVAQLDPSKASASGHVPRTGRRISDRRDGRRARVNRDEQMPRDAVRRSPSAAGIASHRSLPNTLVEPAPWRELKDAGRYQSWVPVGAGTQIGVRRRSTRTDPVDRRG